MKTVLNLGSMTSLIFLVFILMMTKVLHLIDNIPVVLLLLVALTLGLAPFVPEPHLWEKLKMLGAGTLSKPIDIFDLLLHAVPWIVLLLKLARMAYLKRTGKVG